MASLAAIEAEREALLNGALAEDRGGGSPTRYACARAFAHHTPPPTLSHTHTRLPAHCRLAPWPARALRRV